MMDVHTEHCCVDHGCKYGDDMCTVVREIAPQSFLCEYCHWDAEQIAYWLGEASTGQLMAELSRRGVDIEP